MRTTETAILGYDVVSSTVLAADDLAEIRSHFLSVTPEPTKRFDAGDSGVLLFEECPAAYRAAKHLLQGWARRRSVVPLLRPGLRLGMHYGPVYQGDLDPSIFGAAVNLAVRLTLAADEDIFHLSEQAYDRIKDLLDSDGVISEAAEVTLKHLGSIRSLKVPYSRLLAPEQYIVRLEPPTDLLLHLTAHPEQLYLVPPRRFESVVADLLSDLGHEVELTKQTRDNGIDIIAISRINALGPWPEKYLIQCKRNSPRNRVGIEVVHELLGVGAEEPHTGLVIVTTSTFTKPAVTLALKDAVRWRLRLKDYQDLRDWLARYAARHG